MNRTQHKNHSMPPASIAANNATRREFLGAGAVLMLNPAALESVTVSADAASLATPDTSTLSPAADNVSSDVTPATIAEAEKLAGIRFTDQQRQMLARSIGEQLTRFRERTARPFLPNTLAPAQTFDPRLPGMDFSHLRPAVSRSADNGDALPRHDEDIAFAPVSKLSRWIERGELTSVRLTNIYLDRLKRYDPKLQCVITLTGDLALAQAQRADAEIAAGRYRGPLHGIPYGIKDLFDTAGIRTTWGAEPYVDRVPEDDATVVKRLEEAGAVLVAKLSLGALAYNDIWFGGRTNNPWNVQHGSSGSSAGSAAATAAGLVGFAIGTETYGSIVSPCMRCGTTGLRTTFGRVSRSGAMALCWSLDKVGPICRTVEDTLLVLDATNGYDANDPSSIKMPLAFDAKRPVRGLRLGYNPAWFEGLRVHDLDRQALDHCRDAGVELVEIDLPDWPYASLLNILLCEAAAAFEELTRTGQDATLKWQEPQAWPNTFRQTWFVPGIELVQADRLRRRTMQMMAERFEMVDAIISPTFAASLLLITNNTGHPSLTLRTGFRNGQPHGITLVGNLFDEGTLGSLGMAVENAFDVWHVKPPLDFPMQD